MIRGAESSILLPNIKHFLLDDHDESVGQRRPLSVRTIRHLWKGSNMRRTSRHINFGMEANGA